MTKQVEKNYTDVQEARIRETATVESPLNQSKAEALGAEFGKSARSVIAKAIRMNVPYAKKVPVSKTGEPVTRKETLVEEIGAFVPGSLDGLEKASKPALANILAAFRAYD